MLFVSRDSAGGVWAPTAILLTTGAAATEESMDNATTTQGTTHADALAACNEFGVAIWVCDG